MEPRDFLFYGKTIKVQKPLTEHLALFPATKKNTSDQCNPPNLVLSQKNEAKGLGAALCRGQAAKQAQDNTLAIYLEQRGANEYRGITSRSDERAHWDNTKNFRARKQVNHGDLFALVRGIRAQGYGDF
jgi:hypothetical protein